MSGKIRIVCIKYENANGACISRQEEWFTSDSERERERECGIAAKKYVDYDGKNRVAFRPGSTGFRAVQAHPPT